jgi:hypothetical protein
MVVCITTEFRSGAWLRVEIVDLLSLQIKFKEGSVLSPVLVVWMGASTSSPCVVGGFAPAGLNVNNSDNDNNGVGILRNSCFNSTSRVS